MESEPEIKCAFEALVQIANSEQVTSYFQMLDKLLPDEPTRREELKKPPCDLPYDQIVSDAANLECGEVKGLHNWFVALDEAIHNLRQKLL